MARPSAYTLFVRALRSLNESQARWSVAQQTFSRGRGGTRALSRLAGFSPTTIIKGTHELGSRRPLPLDRTPRRPGGGRPRLERRDAGRDRALRTLLEETTAGGPRSALLRTRKSTARIAEERTRQGIRSVSPPSTDDRFRIGGLTDVSSDPPRGLAPLGPRELRRGRGAPIRYHRAEADGGRSGSLWKEVLRFSGGWNPRSGITRPAPDTRFSWFQPSPENRS